MIEDYRSLRHQRLRILEEWLAMKIDINWSEAPRVLQEHNIVSENYTMKNLHVDLWYLKREYVKSYANFEFTNSYESSKPLFNIILRALLDLSTGRPCDLGIWKKDLSPDFSCCSEEAHLCHEDAERFLISLSSASENLCGISSGKLRDLAKRIKKDPIFSIGSFIGIDS